MSGIFGGGSPTPPPDTSDLDDREALAEKNDARERKKIASRSRSRRNSGKALVMTSREVSDGIGNEDLEETLGISGGVRNPRANNNKKKLV